MVEVQRFWFFFVFCITNNKLYLNLGSRGKNHLLGQQRYWGIRDSDISCGISGFVAGIGGHPSAPGAGGPVRSLSVSWRTKEAPPLRNTGTSWPSVLTLRNGVVGSLFIGFGHRPSGHLNLSMPSVDRHVSDYGRIEGELDLARKNLRAVDYPQLEQGTAPSRRCVWPYGHSRLKSWANSPLPMLSQEESTWISLCRLKGWGRGWVSVCVCATLGKPLNLSGPQILHPQSHGTEETDG